MPGAITSRQSGIAAGNGQAIGRLAGEIAANEDDGGIAFAPFPPAQLDLGRLHP
jgi:hypothetical protein